MRRTFLTADGNSNWVYSASDLCIIESVNALKEGLTIALENEEKERNRTEAVSTPDGEYKNEAVFRDMPAAKALWTFAMPSIATMLVLLLYNLADTYFLGRVGNPYMVAATSLVLPVYNVTIAFANLFGAGGGTLIARLMGRHDPEEAKKVSGFSVVMSVIVSVIFALIMYVFEDPILYFLGASGNTILYARQYTFWVLIIGALPSVLLHSMSNLAKNAGLSKEAGIGNVFSTVMNIILDPVFMFVILPEGMEVVGAAVATLISCIFNALYFIAIFRINRSRSVLRMLPTGGLPRKDSILSIFSVGIPAALSMFLYDLTNIVINKLAAGHGDIPLAAIGIVLKAERLPLNICVGLCMGMVPLVGYSYAAGNYKRMKEIHRTTQLHGCIISVICIVLYEIFAGVIMNVFISDAETVVLGTAYLRVRCLATILMFACFNYTNFFQGVGMGKQALVLSVVRQLVFNIPILLILNSVLGMTGVIWTQFIADGCTAVVSIFVYRATARKTWDRLPQSSSAA